MTIEAILEGLSNGTLIDARLGTDYYEDRYCSMCMFPVSDMKTFFIHLIAEHDVDPKTEIHREKGDGLWRANAED